MKKQKVGELFGTPIVFSEAPEAVDIRHELNVEDLNIPEDKKMI